MRNVTALWLVILLIAGSAMAVDHGAIGMSGEVRANTSNTTSFDLTVGEPRYYEPNTMIGLRLYSGEYIGIDIRLGYMSLSGIDRDTASHTYRSRAYGSFALEGGLVYRAAETKRSYLGILARMGITSNKLSLSIWDPTGDGKYEEFNAKVFNIFFGMEPTYFFNDHFSIYSTFGLKIRMIPNSKYVDYPNAYDHADFLAGNYMIKDHKDSQTWLGFDGIWLGMRYYP